MMKSADSEPPPPREPITSGSDAESSGVRIDETLELVSRVGMLISRVGGAAFRVRESMRRLAFALGATRAEIMVTPEAICASVGDSNHWETRVSRIHHGGVNMNALCRVEVLTREIAATPSEYPPARIRAELDAIEKARPLYPRWVTVLSLGAACAAFCGVIKGSYWQMAAAFAGASVGQFLRMRAIQRGVPTVAVVSTSAVASCIIAELAVLLENRIAPFFGVPHITPDLARLASVLYLIPGVLLVTSWVDIIHFDFTSGLARAAHASVIMASIAGGVLIFLQLSSWVAF